MIFIFQEISWKRLILKLLKETIGRIWFGSMKRFNCDSLILWLTLHLYTFFRYFIKRKMKSVIFKSSIIYSFITLMIVIFLLTVICDLKYINDKKTEVNESMKYEDQLNMFLSSLRSKGEYKENLWHAFAIFFCRNWSGPRIDWPGCWKAHKFRCKNCILQTFISPTTKCLQVI